MTKGQEYYGLGYYSDGTYYSTVDRTDKTPFDRIVDGLMADGQSREAAQRNAALAMEQRKIVLNENKDLTKQERPKENLKGDLEYIIYETVVDRSSAGESNRVGQVDIKNMI